MTILDDRPATEADVSGAPESATPTAEPARTHRSILRRLWGAFGTLVTIVAVLAAVVAVVLAVSAHETAAGEYDVFGHPVMSVLSGSMTPAIRTGDLVIDNSVTATQAVHLRVGQIISFHQGQDVFTHRIHAIEHVHGQLAYQTKGDANNAPDGPLVSPSEVIGVYSGKVPDGGYILNALHKPTVFVLLLIAPVLWLLSTWLFDKAKEADEASRDPKNEGVAAH
jgi:signal peptidase